MLGREYHGCCQTIAENDGLNSDSLTSSDLRTIEKIREFLQAFYDTTKATEGSKVTLDKVMPSLDFMAIRFEDAIRTHTDDPFMMSCLDAGYIKVLKYCNRTERSPVYIAAIVLDPTLKWDYFEDWEDD